MWIPCVLWVAPLVLHRGLRNRNNIIPREEMYRSLKVPPEAF